MSQSKSENFFSGHSKTNAGQCTTAALDLYELTRQPHILRTGESAEASKLGGMRLFRGLANITGIVKQAQEFGSKLQQLQEVLKTRRATGTAGGGMVEVEVNGLGDVLNVRIEPNLVEGGERELIEDLLPAAINQAIAKAKEMHAEGMKDLTGQLNIPGMEEAISQLGVGNLPGDSSR